MSPRSRTRPAPSAVVREKALAAGAGQWLDDLPGRADAARGALLLERLDRSLHELALPIV